MHSRRALAAMSLTVALALGVAACGEDQEFIDDYNKATAPLQKLSTDIGGAVNSGSADPAGIAAQFDKLAKTSAQVNDDLAELEAPDDAKEPFDDLRAALQRTEKNLEEVAAAAKANKPARAQEAARGLVADSEKITTAENAVAKAVED